MAKVKNDLTNHQFGELTVIEYAGKGKWKCKCSCGKECEKFTTHLTSGAVTSCGHNGKDTKFKDINGQRFGKLTVIKYNKDSKWLCHCDCGNNVIVRGFELRNNEKTSCGKCEYNKRLNDLTGKTFGNWTVNKYIGNKKWNCTCNLCHRNFDVLTQNLLNGTSKSCEECSRNVDIDYTEINNIKIGSVDKYLGKSKYECTCGNCGRKVNRASTKIRTADAILCKHCSQLRLVNNMQGKVINNWRVNRYIGGGKWNCTCLLCNKESDVFGYNIRSNHSESCGCSLRKDLVGKHIGEWEVLEYVGNYYYRCRCSCGNEKLVLGYSLRYGESESCGCKKFERTIDTLLSRYNDIAPSKIKNPTRNIEQIEILNSKELFTDFLINKNTDKLTVSQLCELFGVGTSNMLLHIHKYQLENLVDIRSKHSKQELDVLKVLRNIFEDHEIILGDKTILHGKELDIYIPSKKIAIEVNGTYWHSSIYKSRYYHQNKTLECFKNGIHLIHLFEYEWNNKDLRNKIENYIINICDSHSNNTVYARDCTISTLDKNAYMRFCELYHLQGSAQAQIIYGLHYNNELVQIMSFGKPRFNSNYDYELIRLCIKTDFNILGGSERLFKHFINDINPKSVISYCDISKFSGNVYNKLGFKLNKTSNPGYVWVEPSKNIVLQRYQTQKKKLIAYGFGTEEQTEDEIMASAGFLKIYNSGNYVFTYSI